MDDIMKRALELIANMEITDDEASACVAINLADAALNYDADKPNSVALFELHAAFAVDPKSYDIAA